MRIAVTGHRPQRLKGQEKLIKRWAVKQLKSLQPSEVYVGMAQGVDQIVALAAKNMGIPVVCCYPFPKNNFHPTEEYIMDGNRIVFVCPEYSRKSYIKRDQYMVDHADLLLCVWDGLGHGGTFATRQYAQKKNVPIIEYEGLK